jgi:phage terminase large subunit-like protein
MLSPATGKADVIGVDWGRTNDFTVFTVVCDTGEVLTIDRFKGIEYSIQRARREALYERYGKPTIIAESNSMGGPVCEQLARDGLKVRPFVTTNASKSEAVEALALAFERGEIKIPDNPVLIGELQAFEAKPLPSGLMRYEAPNGGHDDCVMALAIAWQGITGHNRTKSHAEHFRAAMTANASLTKSSMGGDSDLTPSDYPEGGAGGNPWYGRRWNM